MSNHSNPAMFTLCFLTMTVITQPAIAGKLADLETAASQPTARERERSTDYASDANNSDGVSLFGALLEFTANVVVLGGHNSLQRYANSDAQNESGLFRHSGDPILPTLSLSSQFLNGTHGISGQSNHVELGLGLLGISFTDNTLNEKGDRLNLSHTLVHYRMSAGNDFSWDFAFGKGTMDGNQSQQGDIFALPMRLRISPEMHMEYYPVWSSYNGGHLAQQAFSLNWQRKYIGLSVGFKTLSAGDTRISGMFSGININY